jgi:hypothetical protein
MLVTENAGYGEVARMSKCKCVLARKRDSHLSSDNMVAKPPRQRQLEADRNIVISTSPFRALDDFASKTPGLPSAASLPGDASSYASHSCGRMVARC